MVEAAMIALRGTFQGTQAYDQAREAALGPFSTEVMPLNRTPGTEGNLTKKQGLDTWFASKPTSRTILEYQVRNELMDEAGGLPRCPVTSSIPPGGVSWRCCIPGIERAIAFSQEHLRHLQLDYAKIYEVELRMYRDDGFLYSSRLSPSEKVQSSGVRVEMKLMDPEDAAALTGWIVLATREAAQPVGQLYTWGTFVCRSLFGLDTPAIEVQRNTTGNIERDRKLEALVTGTWHARGGSIAANGGKRARSNCFAYVKGQQRSINFSADLHVPTPCDVWLKVSAQGINVCIKAALDDEEATPPAEENWRSVDWTSSEGEQEPVSIALL
ncbi:unnamed protein product [Sympodiomycopsis kandeliae]